MRANRSRVILLIAAYLLVVFVPSKVNRAAEPWASRRHSGRLSAGAARWGCPCGRSSARSALPTSLGSST
jgi:hypothetical protein